MFRDSVEVSAAVVRATPARVHHVATQALLVPSRPADGKLSDLHYTFLGLMVISCRWRMRDGVKKTYISCGRGYDLPTQSDIDICYFLFIYNFSIWIQGRTQEIFQGGAKDRNKYAREAWFFLGFRPSLNSVRPPPLKGLFYRIFFFWGGGAKPPKLQNATLIPKESTFNCTNRALIIIAYLDK